MNAIPTNWQMFSDGGGDAAVTEEVVLLTTRILAGQVRRTELENEIKALRARVSAKGFGEVYDTEPRGELAVWFSYIASTQGWLPVDQWEI